MTAPIRRAPLAAALAAVAVLGAGCGADSGPTLAVSADTSLKSAFTDYGKTFAESATEFSFAGSRALAARVSGADKPDVVVSADVKGLRALFSQGRVERPVLVASDQLVIAASPKNIAANKASSLDDLAKPGVRVAMAAASVPLGAATSALLDQLPRARRATILANVRAKDRDGAAIVDKLTAGGADAGLVYGTDWKPAAEKLGRVDMSGRGAVVAYGAAIVTGARQPVAAKAFIFGLLSGTGSDALSRAGFLAGPPPRCGGGSVSGAACPDAATSAPPAS